MADGTSIEWTDATWNPITGCSVVSAGCTNCYAMRLAGTRLQHSPSRIGLTKLTKAGPVWTGEVRFNHNTFPLRWKKARRIFVCAHGDLFHANVPDAWIDAVFRIMGDGAAAQHSFQVLTKRPARMRAYMATGGRAAYNAARLGPDVWPPPNVWMGVSVEDQATADERIPELLATPARRRFVSCEPLLGPVHLTRIAAAGAWLNALDDGADDGVAPSPTIDWVIAGGESGPDARPMHPDWVRSLLGQCARNDTPFFFKQWGMWAPISHMSDDQIEACYPPINDQHPDATRLPIKEMCVLHANGTCFSGRNAYALGAFSGGGAMTMFKIGKKAAGAELDGREWREFPE